MNDWLERAECRKYDPDIWFPSPPYVRKHRKLAVAICKTCPVKPECREYAETMPSRILNTGSVWAGVSGSTIYNEKHR